jgi:hypothetical protein
MMRGMRLAALGLAVIVLSLPATATPRSSAPAPAARPGGLSAQPSMRPWRYGGANPDGWWCRPRACRQVANGTTFVDRELPLIAGLGAGILRLEFPWPLLEPRRGVFDWRRSDYIVRQASRHRIAVQPVLVYSPSWAADGASSPPRAGDFSRFVRRFATRYRHNIDYYELWNEPDIARYWEGTQAEYVGRVLVPGYRAVKAADPRAKVLLGGPTTADVGWLHGIYRHGGGRSFDVLTYHDYTGDPAALVRNAFAAEGVLEAHGQGWKPIWLGEYGVQEPYTADVHQQRLFRAALTEEMPLARALWYTLRDDFPMTCCPPAPVKSEYFGVMTDAYVRKQGYGLMRQLLVARRSRR